MAEVHIIGQIVEALDFEDNALFAKWSFNAGSSWRAIEGFTEGQTQLSVKSSPATLANNKFDGYDDDEDDNSKRTTTTSKQRQIHSWSHPIDLHYSTKALQGWPRLEFQVWGVDWLGKCNISAYGFMSIPTRAGQHQLTCATWRPVGDFRRRLIDYVTGYRMHLVEPSDMIGSGLNRHVIQSISMGTIRAELQVVLKDFHEYGVDI